MRRAENNLLQVKRLIKRTDMRNPDPLNKRYTSLAWAAVLGHEETFEFLLVGGHDDHEYSKVRQMHLQSFYSISKFDRTRTITLFSFCWPTRNHLSLVRTARPRVNRNS